MQRRQFILGAAVAATVATLPAPNLWPDADDLNYWAVRERIIELLEAGHQVERWELDAPRGGYRRMLVYTKHGSLSWNQPWL
jgi:hypothetical protein